MPRRSPLFATLIVVFAVLAFPVAAAAQPGSSSLDGSEYHATPPVQRVMPSPRPSLPPPLALAPGEVPNTPFPTADRPFSVVAPGFVAHIERDGRIRFSDRRASGGLLVDPIYGPIGHAEFDITDWLLDQLGAGDDPYLAQRLAIMDQTRGSRIRRRINHDHRTMERALGDLPAYLRAVWEYQGWSHAERRHILFELWDEAAEDGNDFIREGGTRARIIIARFISSRLPAASSDAYTREELERINRQRSATVEFSPYQREAADKRRIAESESGFASIGLPLMRAF